MNPLVSVIIPTHNRSQELERAMRSVLLQTEQSFEILVADDASTEDLGAVIARLNDTRIRHIRNDEKTNANVMRNHGIREAKGQYIAFLDSDDEWTADHLQLKHAWLEKHTCDGVYGSSIVDDGETQNPIISRSIPKGQHPAEFLLSGGSAPIPSWMVKTEVAKKILFDESLKRHQDYEFFVRFALAYKWSASPYFTLIIHWKKGAVRNRHAASEIQFVSRYYKELSPLTWKRYHLTHYSEYQEIGADSGILAYYKRESMRHTTYITFMDYCTMHSSRKGIVGFFLNWIGFSFLIFKSKFSKALPPTLP
ncbi:MAG: glycosyltransferase family 2 protein [Flavobacteriales bacterium]